MTKKVVLWHDLPDGLSVVSTLNCVSDGRTVRVQDKSLNAKLVLKDATEGHNMAVEYVVSFFPNFGWAWGE